jgi:hypothetical protein
MCERVGNIEHILKRGKGGEKLAESNRRDIGEEK